MSLGCGLTESSREEGSSGSQVPRGLMPSSKGALMRQWQTANDVDEIAAAERRETETSKETGKAAGRGRDAQGDC